MAVQPIPEGFHTVSPYLSVQGVPKLIEFLEEGLGGEVIMRHSMPDGTVMNATVRVGDSMVMMGEVQGERKPWPCMMYLYVEDTDTLYRRAMAAGAKSIMEPVDQFYGDRTAAVEDGSGNQWWIATHQEDMSDEELMQRAANERG